MTEKCFTLTYSELEDLLARMEAERDQWHSFNEDEKRGYVHALEDVRAYFLKYTTNGSGI